MPQSMTQPFLRLSSHGLGPAIKEKKTAIKGGGQGIENGLLVATLQKARDKVAGQTRTGVLLGPEVLHNVGQLLPIVEGLLELGVALEEEDVDDAQLADVAVLLKFLADLCADGGHGHAQGIHGLDFGGL